MQINCSVTAMPLNEKRKFGKINKAPPSFFARVPSSAVTDKRLSDKEFRVLAALCAYGNNQGFAWPNIDTLYDDLSKLKAPISRRTISRALDKLRRGRFIEVISRHRSHEKWRHIMGTVHRVIYDDRMTVDDLHDAMTKETPPPIDEHALPKQVMPEDGEGKQQGEVVEVELVEVTSLAQWYCRECHGLTGQLRLVNEAAFNATKQALADNSADSIKAIAIARLMECRQSRQTPPQHLGFMAKGSGT
jgi:Fe2+ or Zn2+ uptake regulation protein